MNNMKNFSEIIEKIKSYFNGVHVEIEKHDCVGGEYEVSCYGLNEKLFDEAYDLIFDLNDELCLHQGVELIPILYTREDTACHFPQIHLMLLEESMKGMSAILKSSKADCSLAGLKFDIAPLQSLSDGVINYDVELGNNSAWGQDADHDLDRNYYSKAA